MRIVTHGRSVMLAGGAAAGSRASAGRPVARGRARARGADARAGTGPRAIGAIDGPVDLPSFMTRPIAPADLIRRQVVLEEHDPLPDGSGAVVVRRSVHGETYRSHLHLVRFADGRRAAPRALTAGAVRDGRPRVSPDGRRVAFLRSFPDDPDRPTAVMVQPLDGGEPWALWAPEHGVSEMAWSPDGRRMAYVAAVPEARFVVGRETKGRVVTARRITRTDWRWDEVGHRDRWDAVWVGPVREGATAAPADAPGGRREGDRLVARRALDRLRGRPAPRRRPPAAPLDLGDRGRARARPVPAAGRPTSPPSHARSFASPGTPGRRRSRPTAAGSPAPGSTSPIPSTTSSPGLFVAPFAPEADGPAPAVALAPDLDRPIGAWNDTDLNGWMASSRPGPSWDGPDALVALVSEARARSAVALPGRPGDGRPPGEPVAPDRRRAGRLDARRRRRRRLRRRHARRPPDGAADRRAGRRGRPHGAAPPASAPGRPSAAPGAAASPGRRCGASRRPARAARSRPGSSRRPAPATRPLPTVVNVHGGPLGAWSPAPSIENVLLAVARLPGRSCRTSAARPPTAGPGSGRSSATGAASTPPTSSPRVDHVVGLGLADPARLGILGLSYGGFMVNWLVGAAPDRFAAAVSENGVDEPGQRLGQLRLGPGVRPDGAPRRRVLRRGGREAVAPVAAAARRPDPDAAPHAPGARPTCAARPPTTSSSSSPCATSGARSSTSSTRSRWHTFAITGRPDRRIDRNERMLAWFDRFLKG